MRARAGAQDLRIEAGIWSSGVIGVKCGQKEKLLKCHRSVYFSLVLRGDTSCEGHQHVESRTLEGKPVGLREHGEMLAQPSRFKVQLIRTSEMCGRHPTSSILPP
ncbi:hypothetical protein C7M84_009095 [Penaeus vannamei]|uniref:Uncharacterized protein n=1 Tax=Penaeus vannamei TaxID=6689 RepID=A0A3R7MBW0_PENVA|nr:hypothetical protein C7M84_009095 [Penaeus vannamei]